MAGWGLVLTPYFKMTLAMKNDNHDYRNVIYQNKIKVGMIMYLFATIQFCLIWNLNYVQHNKNFKKYEAIVQTILIGAFTSKMGYNPPPQKKTWACLELSN